MFLLPDRAEGDAAQQMIAQRKVKIATGNRNRKVPAAMVGPVDNAGTDLRRDERRRGLRLSVGQDEGEGVFVPGGDKTEDGGRGDAGRRFGQDDFEEGLHAGIAVNQRRLLILLWESRP